MTPRSRAQLRAASRGYALLKSEHVSYDARRCSPTAEGGRRDSSGVRRDRRGGRAVHAQPAEPPGPEANPAARSTAPAAAPVLDEGKIRELVDREVARS